MHLRKISIYIWIYICVKCIWYSKNKILLLKAPSMFIRILFRVKEQVIDRINFPNIFLTDQSSISIAKSFHLTAPQLQLKTNLDVFGAHSQSRRVQVDERTREETRTRPILLWTGADIRAQASTSSINVLRDRSMTQSRGDRGFEILNTD